MALDPISNNDPAGWHQKITDLVRYWNGGAAGPTAFSGARSMLNAMAAEVSLPNINPSDSTAAKRGKINALLAASGLPDGADLYADFTTGRMWDNGPQVMGDRLTSSHSGAWLPVNGVLTWFPPNSPLIADGGLWSEPTRTNKLRRSKYGGTGWIALNSPTFTPDVAMAPNGATEAGRLVTTVGLSQGFYSSAIVMTAGTPLTLSVLVKDNGGASKRVQLIFGAQVFSDALARGVYIDTATGVVINKHVDITATSRVVIGDGWVRISATVTPNVTASAAAAIYADSSTPTDNFFWHAQLEEGSFATSPIVTEGDAAQRTGPRNVISGLDLTYGVAGFVKVDVKNVGANGDQVLTFNDGSLTNRFILRNLNGTLAVHLFANSVDQGQVTLTTPFVAGEQTIAFAAGPDFMTGRVVGASQPAVDGTCTWPAAITNANIGGDGFGSTRNLFQTTEKLSLFRGTPDRPINQAFWDSTVWPAALEAAA